MGTYNITQLNIQALEKFPSVLLLLGSPFVSFPSLVLLCVIVATNLFWFSPKQDKVRKPKTIHFDADETVKDVPEGKRAKWEFVAGAAEKTLLTGNCVGRSSWKVVGVEDNDDDIPFNREKNANSADLIYRNAMRNSSVEKLASSYKKRADSATNASLAAANSALAGSLFYSQLQTTQGFWPGDYGGPMFLLPGFVIACYVTGVNLGSVRKAEMLKYILNHQQGDGGWGTHIEGESTAFGSTLNYTAARLCGLKKNSKEASRARLFLHTHGGALGAPQWAKLWLAVLGCYDWKGVNPVPPELWLLPNWFPFHPGRMWCHCRMVYLPMSTLFGLRYTYENAENDSLILSLRKELYYERYECINWGRERETINPGDVYNPQTNIMTFANWFLHYTLENPVIRTIFAFPLNFLRKRAIDFCCDMVAAEDEHTNWIDIGPVNKAFQIIVAYAREGSDSKNFRRHISRIPDYLWVAEDGMKVQGYNGSQFWDSAFAAHAIGYSKLAGKKFGIYSEAEKVLDESMKLVYEFTDAAQVREDVRDRRDFFRDVSTGGWPFSTRDHGWPISDCTSEGIKTVILLHKIMENKDSHTIDKTRLEEAVSIVLGMHNPNTDGGWASYEQNRGYEWYEVLNPAQVFGDIMIDYSYTECTSACVQGLVKFAKTYPESALAEDAIRAALMGSSFILKDQNDDGSWYGSWAVCFTYGGWFGVEGLCAALEVEKNSKKRALIVDAIKRGIGFFLSKQSCDGGWGESVEACSTKYWVPCEEGSQVVQTAWAVLALVRASESLAIEDGFKELLSSCHASALKGCNFLRKRQEESGDWKQENISGVFNKSCGITYTAYRNVFPIWALARYAAFSSS